MPETAPAFATSSGSPIRPIGMVDTIRAIRSADCRLTSGVSIGPGLTTFERIRRSFRSVVQVRTKDRIAALLAAYTPKAAVPLTLATEPLRMIEPPSFSSGKAFWTVKSVPLTLMLNILSKCSSVTFRRGQIRQRRRWRKRYRFALSPYRRSRRDDQGRPGWATSP
jgi:hypothetical protein